MEKGVIWVGELEQQFNLEIGFIAYRYKVIEVLRGELIIRDSIWGGGPPLYFDYNNTKDHIWIFGGLGNICYEYLPKGKLLLATLFNSQDHAHDERYPIGYNTSLCSLDYIELSENDVGFDYVDDASRKSVFTLDQLKVLIRSNCTNRINNASDQDKSPDPVFQVWPNPSSGRFFLTSKFFDRTNLEITVYNTLGQIVWRKKSNERGGRIDLQNAADGIYFMSIRHGYRKYVKRIVKNSLP